MKRLNCSGLSGLECVPPRFCFCAFFTCPDIFPPLASLIPHQAAIPSLPHSTFATKRTGIARLLCQGSLKGGNSGFQCGYALSEQKNALHSSEDLGAKGHLGRCQHG
jgi:hypothetical protein